jgi:torulene dioxygenase
VKDVLKRKGEIAISHWFDGFSHVYRFQIVPNTDGSCKVLYNSRRQVDELIERIRTTGKVEMTFAQKRDPCRGIFQKLMTTFEPFQKPGRYTSNIGVTIAANVPGYDGLAEELSEKSSKSKFNNLMVFTDNASGKKLDPDTLEPLGVTDQRRLHPELKGPISCAHPQYENGDVYNYNLDFSPSPTYRIFKTSMTTGNTEILASISGPDIKASYLHSFFLTQDFLILAIWPSYFAAGGMPILWNRNILDSIAKFNPEHKTKWIVVDRKNGRGHVATFNSPAAFSFHSINAWQEIGKDGKIDIYCDLIQYPDLHIIHSFYYENLMSTGPGVEKWAAGPRKACVLNFKRYHLAGVPPKKSALKRGIKATPILTIPGGEIGDLHSINPLYSKRKQRYVWSLLDRGHSSFVDGIGKTDLDTQTTISWECPHHTPGEPVFVGRPGAEDEDDGAILSVVLNGDSGTSYLLVLDAKTLVELGRAEVEVAVGLGFHGRHYRL